MYKLPLRLSIMILFVGGIVSITLLKQTSTSEVPMPISSEFVPKEYELIFWDEFDPAGLDTTKWKYRYVNRPYKEGFLSEESISQPDDGYLHLITSYRDNQFLSAMIQSIKEFKYGYFEARIRFQSLRGHHGAFWLQSPVYGTKDDDPSVSGAEIDIIEFFGSDRPEKDVKHTVNWNAYDEATSPLQKRFQFINYHNEYGVELSDDFHIFSLLWTPQDYVFAIDGIETWRTSEGMSDVPEYIVLSLITSKGENEYLDKSKLPNEMLVDYIRVYIDEGL